MDPNAQPPAQTPPAAGPAPEAMPEPAGGPQQPKNPMMWWVIGLIVVLVIVAIWLLVA